MPPEKLVVALLPPVVSVFASSVTVPLPAREPIVSLPVRSSVPPASTVTAAESEMAAPSTRRMPPELTFTVLLASEPVTERMPADTVVVPV